MPNEKVVVKDLKKELIAFTHSLNLPSDVWGRRRFYDSLAEALKHNFPKCTFGGNVNDPTRVVRVPRHF
jgi:hypothetical protein